MTPHGAGESEIAGRPWRQACRLVWLWVSPVLLLSLTVEILASGREGLWLLLLVFIAPLFGLLLVPSSSESDRGEGFFFSLGAALVTAGLLWANLALAADVAEWLGGPRWSGTLIGALAVIAVTVWRGAARLWPLFIVAALAGTAAPLAVVMGVTDPLPHRVWARVASEPAFRFSSESPWVTEGRVVSNRPGNGGILFLEEHRLIPLASGPVGIVISDGGQQREVKRMANPGRPIVLRPGDRLVADTAIPLRFEGGKLIPGAPLSGIDWADRPLRPRRAVLLKFLGLGVTLVGGAMALAMLAGGVESASRSKAASAGLLLLVVLLLGECWAIYAAAFTPELFLGGVRAPALIEMPALVFYGSRWGRWLSWVVVAGLLSWFLASAAWLRGSMAPKATALWAGLVAAAGLLSLWPISPWRLALAAFGLGASALAPLALAGAQASHSRAAGAALGTGLILYVAISVAGRLLVSGESWAGVIAEHPALVVAPLVCGILWVSRRRRPGVSSSS